MSKWHCIVLSTRTAQRPSGLEARPLHAHAALRRNRRLEDFLVELEPEARHVRQVDVAIIHGIK